MHETFWDRVANCPHKHLSNHYGPSIHCDTYDCSGMEFHCLDCGVYISECQCGSNNGMSGWSQKRWKNYAKKKKTHE